MRSVAGGGVRSVAPGVSGTPAGAAGKSNVIVVHKGAPLPQAPRNTPAAVQHHATYPSVARVRTHVTGQACRLK